MSISMDSMSSYLNNTISQAGSNSSTSGLERTLNSDMSSASDEELMDVCKEFEAYFVEQVLKEMEKTIPDNGDDSNMSQLTDYYKDQMIQKLSSEIAEETGNSLAQQLYEQMKRNYNL
ncbi:MAG: rod-binding protein [Roseburia sp.]